MENLLTVLLTFHQMKSFIALMTCIKKGLALSVTKDENISIIQSTANFLQHYFAIN